MRRTPSEPTDSPFSDAPEPAIPTRLPDSPPPGESGEADDDPDDADSHGPVTGGYASRDDRYMDAEADENDPDEDQPDPADDTDDTEKPDTDAIKPDKTGLGRPVSRKPALIVAGAVFLIGLAGFGLVGGLPDTQPDAPTKPARGDGGASALAPPEARPQPLDPRRKYDKYGFDGADLNPTGSATDRRAASGTQLLTGKDPSVSRGSNENLTDAELRAVTTTGAASAYRTAGEQKASRRTQLDRQFDRQQAERTAIYQTLRRSPKSREQRAEEQADRQERALDHRTAETLLRQVELANQRMGSTAASAPPGAPTGPDAPNMADYHRLKALHGGQLPPSYQPYFAREIAAERAGSPAGISPEPAPPGTTVRPAASPKAMNSGNAEPGNGFYGLTRPGTVGPATNAARPPTIPAVIHGNADAITVRAGSSVKIRLVEETRLVVHGETLTLPAHTLLTGTCSIGTDRLLVSVSTLRVGSAIYPVSLTVYDVDGRAGLSVPRLTDKNRLAQGLAQTGQQAISSPAYFIPQGSFGQQVGGQLAMQTTNTLFQGVRSLAQARLAAVQVTIKPNYRIFLKPNASGNGGAGADFSSN